MGIFTKAASWVVGGLGLRDPRLYAYFGGEETDAGERVNVDVALQLDVVWACVRLISQTIATLPLHLYRTDKADGFGRLADDHPLYYILHDQPNAAMTAVEFWEAMVGCILLWGNAYAAKTMGGPGNARIVALDPLRPDRISIRPQDDGTLLYVYTWAGQTREYQDSEILHIKGFSLDGYSGLSPIALARQSIAHARAQERSSGAIFRNGMRPSGVLTSPDYLTDKQRVDAKAMLENYRGAQATGKVPLLEGGWTFQTLSIPPDDAQLLASRAFSVETLCRWFDTPPVMVGHPGATAWGSGIEQLMLWFLTSCLRAHLKRIEQAVKKDLLTPAERLTMYAEFNFEGLMRADSAGRSALYSAYAQNGLRTRNELRALDNQPPLPGGDDLTVQAALIPVKDLGLVARLPRDKVVGPGAAVMPDTSSGGALPPAKPIAEIKQ